jgi:hypothetical protein
MFVVVLRLQLKTNPELNWLEIDRLLLGGVPVLHINPHLACPMWEIRV